MIVSHRAAGGQSAGCLLDTALALNEYGFNLIPLGQRRKTDKGIEPVRAWKQFETHHQDEHDLRGMFTSRRTTGIGVVMGPISGNLVCRDFDDTAAYHRWRGNHRRLAEDLPTVQTPRGYHVYGRGPEAFRKLGDGEYRGTSRCYTALPPTRRFDVATKYRWLVPLPSGPLPQVTFPDFDLPSVPPSASVVANAERQDRPVVLCLVSLKELGDAVSVTQPTRRRQRNDRLWDLARALKGRTTIHEAKAVVTAWHREAEPIIGTKPFEVSWADFQRQWEHVRHPAGQSFAQAVATAAATPPPACILRMPPRFHRLIHLCACLQTLFGDRAFYLGCRKASEYLGINRNTANEMLRALERRGIIIREVMGRLKDEGKGEKHDVASEWRFIA